MSVKRSFLRLLLRIEAVFLEFSTKLKYTVGNIDHTLFAATHEILNLGDCCVDVVLRRTVVFVWLL